MDETIMVACDLHDRSMLLKIARGRTAGETRSVPNTQSGRQKLLALLRERSQAAGGARVVFAYEASGQGFGLHDELTAAGIECHVLAPTKIARSAQHRRRKTDEEDAEQILQLLRGHVLAGNPLPGVWVPDRQTRDDREVVRTRLDLAEKVTVVKAQIRTLLKRSPVAAPEDLGKGWTKAYRGWLDLLCYDAQQPTGLRSALASLLRQLRFFEKEVERLEQESLLPLAESPRYRAAVRKLDRMQGVGVLTALVFLTELGNLGRFANRRQVSAYLGLVPTSNESGERHDRKGRITRQGPSRVRKVLCQATWSRVRKKGVDAAAYQRIKAKNPKHKKIAVVAAMRRLGIRMWHEAREASPPAVGDGRSDGHELALVSPDTRRARRPKHLTRRSQGITRRSPTGSAVAV